MKNKKIIYGIVSILAVTLTNNKKSRVMNNSEKINLVIENFNKNKIIMFGRDTCPACIKQKTEFKEHFSKVNYNNSNLPAEIRWLPTFGKIINNECEILLEGFHSIDLIIERLGIN